MIHDLTKSGAEPLKIKAHILQKSKIHNTHICLDSIYNNRKGISQSILRVRPPIDTWFDLMSKTRKFKLIKSSQEGVTNSLFIPHCGSIKLANIFNTVFIFDSTYKSNKYSMSFFQIIGVTSEN